MSADLHPALRDEKRWDYVHEVLSLDVVLPLYVYIGIPFQGEATEPFRALLRDYVTAVYLSPAGLDLDSKQSRLARAIDNVFTVEWRNEYVRWFAYVFTYTASEPRGGWREWRTIFMRSSVRAGWWSRLGLPQVKDSAVRQALSDAKTRTEDARELIADAKRSNARSDWDKRVMARMGLTTEALDAGEPFTRLQLTANFFCFYLFWVQFRNLLTPEELNALWHNAQSIAPELEIKPENVKNPNDVELPSA